LVLGEFGSLGFFTDVLGSFKFEFALASNIISLTKIFMAKGDGHRKEKKKPKKVA
jgi:hypothetical protein